MAITWKNINAPDFTGVSDIATAANSLTQQGLKGLSGVVDTAIDAQTDAFNRNLTARLQSTGNLNDLRNVEQELLSNTDPRADLESFRTALDKRKTALTETATNQLVDFGLNALTKKDLNTVDQELEEQAKKLGVSFEVTDAIKNRLAQQFEKAAQPRTLAQQEREDTAALQQQQILDGLQNTLQTIEATPIEYADQFEPAEKQDTGAAIKRAVTQIDDEDVFGKNIGGTKLESYLMNLAEENLVTNEKGEFIGKYPPAVIVKALNSLTPESDWMEIFGSGNEINPDKVDRWLKLARSEYDVYKSSKQRRTAQLNEAQQKLQETQRKFAFDKTVRARQTAAENLRR